mmetsp:Transcript_95108/g.273838  ORF Transcript_95108/g.273838 Transcript_95108/m.273838 type:complete len:394 (+) Transcript_95108:860-2041(+)
MLAESRLHLPERVFEVLVGDGNRAQVLGRVGQVVDVDLPVEREGGRRADEALQLGAREVFGLPGDGGEGHGAVQVSLFAHRFRVDVEDLHAPRLVRQADFHMDLQTPRPQKGLVDEVYPIGHADEQDVVQRIDAVDLGQQLVHDAVVDAGAVGLGASRLTDGVDLVENDHVQLRILALHLVLLLRIGEQVPDVLLGLADVLVQDFGAVDDLRFRRLEELGQLPGDERLARAGRAVQQHAANVVDAQVSDDVRREHPRGEGPSENVGELLVEASNTELLEVEVRPEDAPLLDLAAEDVQLPGGALLEVDLRLLAEQPGLHLLRCVTVDIDGGQGCDGQLQHVAVEVDGHGLRSGEDLPPEALSKDLFQVLILDLHLGRIGRRLLEEVDLNFAQA